MKIWLIRHGMTRLGEEKRYQGALDEGLSELGRAELKKADFNPSRVYVSPMTRATETAAILFPGTKQIVISDLREMNFGAFEGRGWWEMELDPDYRAWVDGNCRGRCPGGEDRAEFSARVCAAIKSLLQAEKDELVIVAHGGTQMAAMEHWGHPPREYYRWQTRCGCGWLIDYDKERDEMRVLQEACFLK